MLKAHKKSRHDQIYRPNIQKFSAQAIQNALGSAVTVSKIPNITTSLLFSKHSTDSKYPKE